MKQIISFFLGGFFGLFTNHKLKILIFTICIPLFFILLFPYSSFMPWLKNTVANATRGNVIIGYSAVKTSISPPRLILKNFNISSQTAPPIYFNDLHVEPNWLSFLKLSPGLKSKIENFFSGTLMLKVSAGAFSSISLNIDRINLDTLSTSLFQLYGISGQSNLNLNIKWMLASIRSGQLTLTGTQIQTSNLNIPSQFGNVEIPPLFFSKANVNIYLKDNKNVNIKNIQLGTPSDKFYINISGSAMVDFSSQKLKKYNLKINLISSKENDDTNLNTYLGLFSKYKKDKGNHWDYNFEIFGKSLQTPPQFKAL